MNAKMTPRPWETTNDQVFAGGAIVADCKWTNHVPEVREANARAIAAVPDLIAALEQCALIAEAIDRAGDDAVPPSMRAKTMHDVYETAHTALAKAGAL